MLQEALTLYTQALEPYPPTRSEHHDLLLANRQIFIEAAKMVYDLHFENTRNVSQTYHIWQIMRERAETDSPIWRWAIKLDHCWQPVCRDFEEFAESGSWKIELNVWPSGMDRIREVLFALGLGF